MTPPAPMPDLTVFLKLGALELSCAVFCGVWLWMLVCRRDLWLRLIAGELALYQRLHLPSGYIAWRRKFAEGKPEIYCAIFVMILSLLGAALAGGAYVSLKHKFQDRQRHQTAQSIPKERGIK